MLHPGLNNLPLAAVDGLSGLEAVHAIEVYNHNAAMAAIPDGANGAYMLDGLLESGLRRAGADVLDLVDLDRPLLGSDGQGLVVLRQMLGEEPVPSAFERGRAPVS